MSERRGVSDKKETGTMQGCWTGSRLSNKKDFRSLCFNSRCQRSSDGIFNRLNAAYCESGSDATSNHYGSLKRCVNIRCAGASFARGPAA